MERRAGALRAAALVPGRRARGLLRAVAARQAHQLLRGLRSRGVRRDTHHSGQYTTISLLAFTLSSYHFPISDLGFDSRVNTNI